MSRQQTNHTFFIVTSATRIRNLYTYLIDHRRPHVDGWLLDYLHFSREVAKVREALVAGHKLREHSAYTNTAFAESEDPWRAFAKQLTYEKTNGISSRGQSVLSWENFLRFIEENSFVLALEEMIKAPNRETFNGFSAAWEKVRQKHGASRNPLLINRTLAACTCDVSSTVNGADFETVFAWLINEKLIAPTDVLEADWYDKNFHLMACLHEVFAHEIALSDNDPKKIPKQLLSIFVWELSQNIANPFSLKKQVVKYGAPGTGKTYSAKQNSRLLFSIWQEKYGRIDPELKFDQCSEIVQFHPSYGYEDFIEGLRPVSTPEGSWQLRLQNGIFKRFCRRAGAWEIDVYQIPIEGPDLAARWTELTLGQLRPYLAEYLKHPSWQNIATLDDSVRIADVTPPFFFIIDEINRAELSRVLGELMLCIEYRGTQGAISTQYAALNTGESSMLNTAGGPRFFIPHNVYLIGTMNTIDRSVESFDLALRRRFRWERIDPDIPTLRYHLTQRDALQANRSKPWAKLADNLEALNRAIRHTDILGPDYEVGHAYLMNLRYPTTLICSEVRSRVWEDSIEPLLEEYLRGSGRAEGLMPEFRKAFGIA
jgi:5-methylcytosine-specific restriction protein B